MPEPMQDPNPVQRITIVSTTTLLEGWSKVVHIVYQLLRRDGTVQTQDRDLLDRGDGVTVLLCNRARGTVLLLRQARVIAAVRPVATPCGAATSQTLEACNGQIEHGETPLACALREVEQETGHRLASLQPVAAVYASPGASLEIVHLFLGEYDDATRVGPSGGLHEEGEDIEVIEVPFAQAIQWVEDGTLCDARSMLVLQHVALRGFFA